MEDVFMHFWSILRLIRILYLCPFCLFCGHIFPRFGILYQEKSGNPGLHILADFECWHASHFIRIISFQCELSSSRER
jgi:hypothetical protein